MTAVNKLYLVFTELQLNFLIGFDIWLLIKLQQKKRFAD